MLTVNYESDENSVIDYTCPDICAVFKAGSTKVTFCPEILGSSEKWSRLLLAVQNNTKYSIYSAGTNKYYDVSHESNRLNISIGAYGSGTVGSLSVDLDVNGINIETLVGLEMLAKCIENGVDYNSRAASVASI